VEEEQTPHRGRPLKLDPTAVAADPSVPAFLAPPSGTPVYYGFPIVDGAESEGFQFGMITDFLEKPDSDGDAYVIAPDGSRAGLIWESEVKKPYFNEVIAPEVDRWGVWAVGLSLPLRTAEDARRYLVALVPDLRRKWEEWRSERLGHDR
jgi:hypothetical protein